jgi:hypothetical protein
VKLKDPVPTSVLEDRFAKALKQIGQVAQSQGRGVVFLFDDQSLPRLVIDNLLCRDDHGVYEYTAPVFGEYLRRCHPRLEED